MIFRPINSFLSPPMDLLLLAASLMSVYSRPWSPYILIPEISSSFCFYMLIAAKPQPVCGLPNFRSVSPNAFLYVSTLMFQRHLIVSNSKPKVNLYSKNRNHLFLLRVYNFKSRNLNVIPDCSPFVIPPPQN